MTGAIVTPALSIKCYTQHNDIQHRGLNYDIQHKHLVSLCSEIVRKEREGEEERERKRQSFVIHSAQPKVKVRITLFSISI
jgi:hypothetical protein